MKKINDFSTEEKEYVFNLPYHLAKAAMPDELCNILTELDFIECKVSALQTRQVVEDYRIALELPELKDRESLLLLKSTTQLASHILDIYPLQVPEQLLGRLDRETHDKKLQHLLAEAQDYKSEPWLRPLTASLPRPDGPLLQAITGHQGMLDAVTVAPNGEYFVSAGSAEIKAWSLANGEELFEFPGYGDDVTDLTITPDGQYLIVALRDVLIKVIDLRIKKECLTLEGHKSAVLAVATTSKGYLISASTDKTLKIWDLQQGIVVGTLSANIGSFNGIAVLPGDKQIISACGSIPSSPREHYVLKVWDLTEEKELYTLGEHSWPVSTVTVTPDGQYAIAGLNSSLVVWDLSTRTKRYTLTDQSSHIQALATINNKFVICASSGDSNLKIWDIEHGRILTTLKGHQAGVMDVAVTPDCKRAISVSLDGTIKIWNLEGIEETASLSRHQDKVTKVVITGDGKWAISTSCDHTAIVWNLDNFQPLLTLEGHTHWVTDIVIMADVRHALSASWDGTLKFWNLATGKLLSTLVDIGEHIDAIKVTPDGQYVVLAIRGKPLQIWDLNQRVERCILQGHTGNVNAISLTTDGQRVISASGDRTLRVWDIHNAQELVAFPDCFRDSILSAPAEEFGSDSIKSQLVGIMMAPDRTRRNPRYRSLEKSDDPFKQYFFEKYNSKTAVVAMPDGQSVISGSQGGVLQIWDISSGKELFALNDNASGITAIDVSPNGRFAFATSGLPYYLSDNTLRVWDLKKRQVVARFVGESPMTTCAVAPDGVTIVVGDTSGQVHFFRFEGID